MNWDGVISPSLRSKEFALLCLSSVLFMASFNMIIPELPAHLSKMGGAEFKGLIISLFAVTAGLSRPFSGKLADLMGRKSVMIFGAMAAAICSALYPFAGGLVSFFLLRFFHGLSTGFKPTGTTAYLADIVSDKNRGEALGLLGMCGSVGMAAGPAIGSAVANSFGINYMFALSSITGLISAVAVFTMSESVSNPKRFQLSMLKIKRSEILEPRVFSSSLVMLLTTYSFGMALTIIPDFSDHLGVANRGLFFTVMLIASVITRLYSGKASDRIGRAKMLLFGTGVLAVAMLLLTLTGNKPMFYFSAAIFGIATGVNSPTLFAWTVDLANPANRGRAISTMFIALELGILSGALVSAEIYANEPERFAFAFASGSLLAGCAALFLMRTLREKSQAF